MFISGYQPLAKLGGVGILFWSVYELVHVTLLVDALQYGIDVVIM